MHGGNAGLDRAVARLEPVKRKHPDVSWADLIAFVGVVAIEEMGGPKIGFSYGRVDEMDPGAVTPDGRLPDADKGDGPGKKTTKGLRDVFTRMGFGDRELVALSGAHAPKEVPRGRERVRGAVERHADALQQLVLRPAQGARVDPGRHAAEFQYKAWPSGRLMMLPSDIALIEDKKLKPYVLERARKDQKKFFADFAAAFEKLETLGTSGLTPLDA